MAAGDILQTSVEFIKGVGPEKAELLTKELGIKTYEDLLFYFPFRYVDRSSIFRISELNDTMPYCQVTGKIERVSVVGRGPGKRMIASLADESGRIELVWFKSLQWMQKVVVPGAEFLVFGKPTKFNNKLNIVHPELESITKEINPFSKTGLSPVYSVTEKLKAKGIDSRSISRFTRIAVEKSEPVIEENLPAEMLEKFRLMPRRSAMRNIHFPPDMQVQKAAEARLKFEELFFIQMELIRTRENRHREIKGHVFDKVGDHVNRFYKECLPFELTNAQKRVVREIRQDTITGKQMNRLIQGDVGSGKTIVALMSMLLALDNGMEAVLMAPTEILAAQHFQNIRKLTEPMGLNIKLLTGSTSQADRKQMQADLAHGNLPILIGTHALLEDWVTFPNLGMVVIDEQHRFGVAQRAALWKKNKIPPHILVMTATPIPRTLAMTLYGDLDVSVIDELPPGRKEIITRHVFENERLKVFGFLKKQIAQGRQIYIVYPLIEESETLDYNNLMQGFEVISREFPIPQYQVSIVHGRMKAADKEFEMQRFKRGETQVLVSTTVIEVGVDLPNASVMLIESAEKFGLAQLHQLRGRVGRGAEQSYCILMTGYKLSEDAKFRMETMVKTNDGFKIADADLQLRGPGDITGTQQSGVLRLKIANLATDQKILTAARHAVEELVKEDPLLEKPANAPLKNYLRKVRSTKPNWILIS